MWVVHEILHVMSDSKEVRLCCRINVENETHSNVLKIIESFNSDVYESTNPLIEGYLMLAFKF